jgi:hypothetical protein
MVFKAIFNNISVSGIARVCALHVFIHIPSAWKSYPFMYSLSLKILPIHVFPQLENLTHSCIPSAWKSYPFMYVLLNPILPFDCHWKSVEIQNAFLHTLHICIYITKYPLLCCFKLHFMCRIIEVWHACQFNKIELHNEILSATNSLKILPIHVFPQLENLTHSCIPSAWKSYPFMYSLSLKILPIHVFTQLENLTHLNG